MREGIFDAYHSELHYIRGGRRKPPQDVSIIRAAPQTATATVVTDIKQHKLVACGASVAVRMAIKAGLVALVLFMSLSDAAAAGWFDDGQAAYDRGDYTTALRIWRPSAEQGDAAAQSGLGAMYAYGKGVQQDNAMAMTWYRKAADQGLASAQYNLGVMYDHGQGLPQNYSAAVTWFRKAAEQDHPDAEYNLGVMYTDGRGVPRNFATAVTWYQKAADQGNASAQSSLGTMYAFGGGRTSGRCRGGDMVS
jgi:TPR repeat protein